MRAVVVTGVGAALLGLSARLFVWPAHDRPTRVDAVVALGGDTHRRAKALSLARAGFAPVAALSLGSPDDGPCPASDGTIEVVCFRPDPASTQGEARGLARLAAERGWHRIIVVPGTTQATRARLRIRRCYPGELLVDPARETAWSLPYDIAYEWAALAKALFFQRAC